MSTMSNGKGNFENVTKMLFFLPVVVCIQIVNPKDDYAAIWCKKGVGNELVTNIKRIEENKSFTHCTHE